MAQKPQRRLREWTAVMLSVDTAKMLVECYTLNIIVRKINE